MCVYVCAPLCASPWNRNSEIVKYKALVRNVCERMRVHVCVCHTGDSELLPCSAYSGGQTTRTDYIQMSGGTHSHCTGEVGSVRTHTNTHIHAGLPGATSVFTATHDFLRICALVSTCFFASPYARKLVTCVCRMCLMSAGPRASVCSRARDYSRRSGVSVVG